MAIQVINDPYRSRSASFGYHAGAGLSSGLGAVFQQLAQQKLGQMQQRETSAVLQKGLGINADQANLLASMPQLIPAYLGGLGQFGQQQQAPEQQAQVTPEQAPQQIMQRAPLSQQGIKAGVSQLLAGEEQQPSALQQAVLRGLSPAQQQEFAARAQGSQLFPQQSALQQVLGRGIAQQLQPQIGQQAPQQAPITPQQVAIQQAPAVSQQSTVQEPTFRDILAAGGSLRERQQRLKEQESKARIEIKKQKQIDTANEPFLKNLNKAVPVAEEMTEKATEMLNLLNTGKVATGIRGVFGSATRGLILNSESQRFLALSNDIASLLASNSGVATNFKIKFAQERKPNLVQKSETQMALTKDILKQADKVLMRDKITRDLIEKNNSNQPANLKSRVDEIYEKSGPEIKKITVLDNKTGKTLHVTPEQWEKMQSEE